MRYALDFLRVVELKSQTALRVPVGYAVLNLGKALLLRQPNRRHFFLLDDCLSGNLSPIFAIALVSFLNELKVAIPNLVFLRI